MSSFCLRAVSYCNVSLPVGNQLSQREYLGLLVSCIKIAGSYWKKPVCVLVLSLTVLRTTVLLCPADVSCVASLL